LHDLNLVVIVITVIDVTYSRSHAGSAAGNDYYKRYQEHNEKRKQGNLNAFT